MASGTIYGTTSNKYIEAKVDWSSKLDAPKNSSTVTVSLYYRRTNSGYVTYGDGTFLVNVNGKEIRTTKLLKITTGDWIYAVGGTVTVSHDDDGRKTITISASGSIPGTTLTSTSLSGTAMLDPVPRASTITSAPDMTLGEPCSVTWTPSSKDFAYQLEFTIGSWSHVISTIKPNRITSYTHTGYTIPLDVAKQFSTKTATMKVTLTTYELVLANYVQVGSASSKTFTVTVPENEDTKPTVSMSLSSSSSLASPYNGLYIQGLSKVKAILDPTIKYNAPIVASNITVNGKTYDSPYESDILSQDGKVSVKATVKDSRGHYGTYYKEIDVIPYSKPYIRAKSGENSIIVSRCNSSADLTDSGTYLKIKAKVVYSKVISDGVQHNYGKIKYRYRQEGGAYSAWQTILDCETQNSDEVITAPLLNGALDIKVNYQVQIIASDDLYDSVPYTVAVPSDAVYMDRPAGGKSMGLGGYSSGDGNLDIHWKTKARGGISLFDKEGDEIPLETILPLPFDQVNEGWNPDNLENGVYAVSSAKALKQGDTVIMYNGVLIQMTAYVGGNVKIQLALTSDETRSPFYRVYWYGNWGNWRSFKL